MRERRLPKTTNMRSWLPSGSCWTPAKRRCWLTSSPMNRFVATGRAEDITQGGGPERGGAAWTYVMVTDRRLRWVPHADLRFKASLDLDDVTAATEQVKTHRYAITLDHRDITRLLRVPAHRLLWFEWRNAVSSVSVARTRLAFSRRDTAVASAEGPTLIPWSSSRNPAGRLALSIRGPSS